MDHFTQSLIAFIQQHHTWGPIVVGLLAFGESLAVISIFIPATFVMIAVGGLIGLGGLDLWPFCIAAAIGAFLGDVISFEVGQYYGPRLRNRWPLKKYPDLFLHAQDFFRRWGVIGIAAGRFIGPLRAFVPLCAGMAHMNRLAFLTVDLLSAPIWSTALLAPGAIGLSALG